MAKVLSGSLLDGVSKAVNALDGGCSDEALYVLTELEVAMTAIIEMIKVEDSLSLVDPLVIDLINCKGK